VPHGPDRGTTVCQLHMRRFKDGDTITIEPWRARAFPVVKDLVVDRSAFDRIITAGGYVSVNAGGAQDGNTILIPKAVSEAAMDSAACIGCGACVAACKNASAPLFMSAKISHLALLPQGQVERYRRVVTMIDQADAEGFGSCSNEGECEAVCPKEIPISNIARMTRGVSKGAPGGRVTSVFQGLQVPTDDLPDWSKVIRLPTSHFSTHFALYPNHPHQFLTAAAD
jgi:succinate dehydrogenase / fumarate reductase iron-sulfur subunit